MTEVSARTTAYALDVLEHEGIDLEALVGDSGLDLHRLRDPTATLGWDSFLAYLDRIEAFCGPEVLESTDKRRAAGLHPHGIVGRAPMALDRRAHGPGALPSRAGCPTRVHLRTEERRPVQDGNPDP